MKLKSILLTAVATLGLTAATMAQVPNYLPTNGLVGWWPFNGNANDESGNNNNGTVNGATLTSDRFGNLNKAFYFDGISSYIDITNNTMFNLQDSLSISCWINTNDILRPQYIINKSSSATSDSWLLDINIYGNVATSGVVRMLCGGVTGPPPLSNTVINQINTWYNIIATYDRQNVKFYINGSFINQIPLTSQTPANSQIVRIGAPHSPFSTNVFGGYIDDIGIWKHALTQQEITAIFNAPNCANNTTITPQTNSLTIGSTATFVTSTSDPNPSYFWQSDLGQGFQTLNNFGNYSGVNTATLNIANVQLSEHNQPIRVISTSGNCVDTSNVAVINILDTCIVTVYDTLLTTVTDTLVINALITGINPPNNLNTLKVFPNPASTHITIDYGNFNAMSGYTLTIVNSIGQTVFTTPINQQTSYIDLSTWTGDGIYFVQIINPQNNNIENRKIVIQ